MPYTLTLFFNTEEEKENFKRPKVNEEVKQAKPKYTEYELNKTLKKDLIKLILETQ